MSLITKNEVGLSLSQGVGLKEINAAAALFIKSVKEIGKTADEITLAHMIHVCNNEHFQKGGKGDTSALQAWVLEVYKNNGTWASSIRRAITDILGMEIKVHREDDGDESKGITTSIIMVEKRDWAKVQAALGEKLVAAYTNGITQDETGKYAKLKAPKKSSALGKKSSGTVDNPPATPVSIGLQLAEETGILAALSAVAGDKQQDNLKQLGGEVARLIEQLLNHPNQAQVRDILTSTNSKLAKGLSLSGVVDKAVA